MRLLNFPDRCVVMVLGAAGSGKSTLAAELAQGMGGVVVSYDEHQRRMPGDTGIETVTQDALAAAWDELAAHCAAGTPVVVDGTHSQKTRRVAVRVIANKYGLDTIIIALGTPLEVCLERQSQRRRRVPAEDIVRQHAAITAELPMLPQEGDGAVIQLSPRMIDQVVTSRVG